MIFSYSFITTTLLKTFILSSFVVLLVLALSTQFISKISWFKNYYDTQLKPYSSQITHQISLLLLFPQQNGLAQGESSNQQLIKYKFYAPLIEEILAFKQKWGIDISWELRRLRDIITWDIRQENHLRSILRGAYGQMVVMQFLVIAWFGLFNCAGLTVPGMTYILVFGCSLLGLILFLFFLAKSKKKLVYFYEGSLPQFCSLSILSRLEKPLMMDSVDVKKEKLDLAKSLWRQSLEHIIELRQTKGVDIQEHLQQLGQELFHQWEEDLNCFSKKIEKMKFGFITVSMILSFILQLGSLMQKLMNNLV